MKKGVQEIKADSVHRCFAMGLVHAFNMHLALGNSRCYLSSAKCVWAWGVQRPHPSLPRPQGSSSLRQAPRTTLMSNRPLSALWMSSARRCLSHWTRPILQSRAPSRAHSSRISRRLRIRTAPAERCPAPPHPGPAPARPLDLSRGPYWLRA